MKMLPVRLSPQMRKEVFHQIVFSLVFSSHLRVLRASQEVDLQIVL